MISRVYETLRVSFRPDGNFTEDVLPTAPDSSSLT